MRIGRVVAPYVAALVLCGCDCFWKVEGRVVDCEAGSPVAAALTFRKAGFEDLSVSYGANPGQQALCMSRVPTP